jgi:hypothetical protein
MIHSAQGIAIAVITYVAIMGFAVFYILWQHTKQELRKARKELAKYHSSPDEYGKARTNTTNAKPDAALIMWANLGSIPNNSLRTKSRMTAIAIAKMRYFILASITRVYRRISGASINKEKNLLAAFLV